MATEIMEGYVQISERGLSQVQRMVRSLGSSATRVVTGPMRLLQGAIHGLGSIGMAAIGAQALGASFNALNPIGLIKAAADAEQLEIAMSTMLGSGEKAVQLIADLNQFANVTPFDNREVEQAAKTLLAMGVDANQIIPTLTSLGDVASGVNMPLGDMAMIFGQIKSAGKLMTQDMMQLAGRGVPILDMLAQQFKVTTAEVKEMIEQGKVGFPDVQRVMVALSSEGGRFAGMMGKQSQSIGGLWSSIVGQAGVASKEIGKVLVEGLDLRGRMSEISNQVGAALPNIRSAMAPIVPIVKGVGDAIFGAFEWFMANGPVVAGVASDIATFFMRGASSAAQMGSDLFGMIGAATGIGDSFMNALDLVGFFFRNSDILVAMGMEKMRIFATNIPEYIRVGFVNGVEWVKWFFSNFGDIMATIGDYAKTVFFNLMENLKNLFTSLWSWVSSGFKGNFEPDWKPLTEGFKSEIKEWPKLIEGELATTSPVLEDLNDELARREADRAKAMTKTPIQKAVESVTKAPAAMAIEDAQGAKAKSPAASAAGSGDLSAKRAGTAEAFSAIFRNMNRSREQEKLDKIVAELKKQTAQMSQNSDARGGQAMEVYVGGYA